MRTLAIFVAAGAAACFTFLSFHWGTTVSMAGASGAIAGLMGAAVALAPLSRLHLLPLHPVRMIGQTVVQSRERVMVPVAGWVALWTAFQFVYGTFGLNAIAEFGGLAAGALIILGARGALALFDDSSMFDRHAIVQESINEWTAANKGPRPDSRYYSSVSGRKP